MRRDQSKFKVYTNLVVNTSRFSKTSLVPKTGKILKAADALKYSNLTGRTVASRQNANELINSVKLPKINFSLTPQTLPESLSLSVPYTEHSKQCSSQRLLSIYESISNLEQSISAPRLKGLSSLPVTEQNPTSKTFFAAVRLGKEKKVLKMLRNQKSLVHIRDCVGKTPLHWAVIRNNLSIASILIGFGADPKAQDFFSRSVIHFAKTSNNQEAVNFLSRYY